MRPYEVCVIQWVRTYTCYICCCLMCQGSKYNELLSAIGKGSKVLQLHYQKVPTAVQPSYPWSGCTKCHWFCCLQLVSCVSLFFMLNSNDLCNSLSNWFFRYGVLVYLVQLLRSWNGWCRTRYHHRITAPHHTACAHSPPVPVEALWCQRNYRFAKWWKRDAFCRSVEVKWLETLIFSPPQNYSSRCMHGNRYCNGRQLKDKQQDVQNTTEWQKFADLDLPSSSNLERGNFQPGHAHVTTLHSRNWRRRPLGELFSTLTRVQCSFPKSPDFSVPSMVSPNCWNRNSQQGNSAQ